jgi:hypothetical protein
VGQAGFPREKWCPARFDVESTYACLKAVENDSDLPTRVLASCCGDGIERTRKANADDANAKNKLDRCSHCCRYFE